ncbi:hypothetical protein DTX80_11275 [Bacilli bacterium]|uniref:Uncharacterized protein n=1 Tax=Oceanobacillus caeni TaxID=405946 RepID=A0ABR5MIU0_9BACI|nr:MULTISPECIES: hypothetical protein [Bacillaceae]KKE78215.1 hypothetical protein WH51_13765 [Bacilli bacterium VT-13-104]PZD83802.1 hypothetical protein DEJ64_13720 [Bacilli bacterium]KPH74539.1 hypothetical protein AFL42_09960 [Oceanobacillus caeni]PZD86505.1 hypothetical protein DEJ60_10365 [Bacilli bacterium]PZD90024.1 hypothetical protein DEJ66_10770 [Bacilli bacterium]
MVKAIFIIILAGLIFKLDKYLIKKDSNSMKDKIFHLVFSVIAFSITLLYILDVPLLNPTEGWKWIYEPLATPLRKLLESYL